MDTKKIAAKKKKTVTIAIALSFSFILSPVIVLRFAFCVNLVHVISIHESGKRGKKRWKPRKSFNSSREFNIQIAATWAQSPDPFWRSSRVCRARRQRQSSLPACRALSCRQCRWCAVLNCWDRRKASSAHLECPAIRISCEAASWRSWRERLHRRARLGRV